MKNSYGCFSTPQKDRAILSVPSISKEVLASGYYNHDKPSDFFTDPDDGIRWFQTGDIGQIDKEDGVLR